VNNYYGYVQFIKLIGWSYPEVNQGLLRLAESVVKGFDNEDGCAICPTGYYCPTQRIEDKRICPPGHACPVGSDKPIICDIGMYAEGSGNSVCKWCPSLYSTTQNKGSTSLNDCLCIEGLYGRADPTFRTLDGYLSKVNPVSVSYNANNEAVFDSNQINKLWNGQQYSPSVPINVQGSKCDIPTYIEYDMGATYAIGKIFLEFWKAAQFSVCGFHIQISNSSFFRGEQISIVECPKYDSCPPFPTTYGSYYNQKIYNFPIVVGRYIRWYWGESTGYSRMYVYACNGDYCSPCRTCPLNSKIEDKMCKCLPGYYLLYANCVPCTTGYTSLLGAVNVNECFPIGYINTIEKNEINRGKRITTFGLLAIYGKTEGIYDGTNNNDGIVNNPNSYVNYLYGSLGWGCSNGWNENPMTRAANRIDYDMGTLGYINWIYARTSTGYAGCMYAFRVSQTGFFTGEDLTLYECGFVKDVYCDANIVGKSTGFNYTLDVPILTRYIRWWMGGSWRAYQFRVGFRPLSACPPDHYCHNLTIKKCEGRKKTYITENQTKIGGTSENDCVCPPSTNFERIDMERNEWDCICNEGLYWENSKCNMCPDGQSAPRGSTSIANCTCQRGKYPVDPDNLLTCTNCTVNHMCPLGSKTPIPCPPGFITDGTGKESCEVLCPLEFYCPGNGEQLTCKTGYFSNKRGNSKCTPCPVGYYCPADLETMLPCPVLHYCPEGSISPNICEPGLYACPKSAECNIVCPPGGFCPGNGTILTCPLGTYSNGGAKFNCTECEEGYFCDSRIQLAVAGCN
jgi:hypothetical protein